MAGWGYYAPCRCGRYVGSGGTHILDHATRRLYCLVQTTARSLGPTVPQRALVCYQMVGARAKARDRVRVRVLYTWRSCEGVYAPLLRHEARYTYHGYTYYAQHLAAAVGAQAVDLVRVRVRVRG